MNAGWRETFWKVVQNEMEHFVQDLADKPYKPEDDYEEFDDLLLERRVHALELLGDKDDGTPYRHHSNRLYYKYLKRADILTDIRAVEYLRLFEKDRAKRHRVSKGFRKAYSICPRDLGKEITKAPREVIDTLNKRADLFFTKMNKMHVDSFRRIDEDTEFIFTAWLKGGEYDEDAVKFSEAQVGVFYEALNVASWGTNVVVDEDDTSFEGDSVEGISDSRGSGVVVSSPHDP